MHRKARLFMTTLSRLDEYINTLYIIDTHEHLPMEKDRPAKTDVLEEWLTHYFSSDLVSAGLSNRDLSVVRDSSKDIMLRWKLVEPFWHAARSTGYGRSLELAARDLYGIDEINRKTIRPLNAAFLAARAKGNHYEYVLGKKSRIAVSIVDPCLYPVSKSAGRFVSALNIRPFLMPAHARDLRAQEDRTGIKIHCLEDWEEATRRLIEDAFKPGCNVVCLKCGMAYLRTLRFDKPARSEAEQAFNELFADRNLPDRRPPVRLAPAFENHMMHFICRLADRKGLTIQVHTGLQEDNGNLIYDSNPALLSNLFLEYQDARFDLFHMGYPYTQELSSLAKNFRNVSIDMCWGHIISPEAARRALIEWLDAVPANKISAFGGDYCFVDGVYGHQKLARRNVAMALAAKVEDGSFDF